MHCLMILEILFFKLEAFPPECSGLSRLPKKTGQWRVEPETLYA